MQNMQKEVDKTIAEKKMKKFLVSRTTVKNFLRKLRSLKGKKILTQSTTIYREGSMKSSDVEIKFEEKGTNINLVNKNLVNLIAQTKLNLIEVKTYSNSVV